jgi:hypothetical protein
MSYVAVTLANLWILQPFTIAQFESLNSIEKCHGLKLAQTDKSGHGFKKQESKG